MSYSMAVDISVIEYIVLVAITRILFIACAAVIMAALTMVIHKFIPLLVTAIIIVLIPMAVESYVPTTVLNLFIHRGLSASDMYLMPHKIGGVYNFVVTGGVYIVIATVLYVVTTSEKRMVDSIS